MLASAILQTRLRPSIALIAILFSCTDPGQLKLSVLWPEQGNAPDQVFIKTEVRLGGGSGAVESDPVGPVRFGDSTGLRIERVPHGEGHVAAIEVTETPGAELALFYGESQPFDLVAGQVTEVQVPLSLQRPPQTSTGAIALADGRAIVNDPNVRLLLVTDTGVRAELSNLPGFVSDIVSVDLPREASSHELDWDLEQGLLEPCSVEDFCPRQVFVRFFDENNFRSRAASTSVVLDTKAPELIGAAVRYTPSEDSLLARVERASHGTTIFVTLNFSEAIDASSLRLTAGDSTLEFSATPLAGTLTAVELSAVVDQALHQEGVYTLMIEMTDLAGNRGSASFDEPAIELDTSADTLIIAQEQVSFVRAQVRRASAETLPGGYTIPAGSTYYALAPSDSLDPAESLPADTFLLSEQGAPQLLLLWSNAERTNLLKTVRPQEDGRWHRDDLRLPNIDIPQLFVSGVDAAGNESAPVGIQKTWFVAASGESSLGQRPHSVASSSFEPGAVIPGGYEELASAPDAQAVVQSASHRWGRIQDEVPAVGPATSLVYDSGRDRIVLFENTGENGVWEFDGLTWDDATPPSGSPPARDNYGLAYDSLRGETMLFGGSSRGDNLNDLWAWNGARWTRIETSTAPPPLAGHQLVFDSLRGRLVTFGLGALWEFDGNDWQEQDTAQRPAPRNQYCMAFDSLRGVTVLFGGLASSDTAYSDTWEWDGMAWTQTSTSGPPARGACGMAFDAARGVTVMHNGLGAPDVGGAYNDTWEWDGQTWVEIPNSETGTNPGIRQLAYDTKRERTVHFSVLPEITWTWDGAAWTAHRPSAPLFGHRGVLAYHEARGEAVLFGLRILMPGVPSPAGTAVWNGQTWQDALSAPAPSAREFSAMAYDPIRERVVLFGGRNSSGLQSDVWEWDGAWTPIMTASTATVPSARYGHAMAFDPNIQEIIMFGGVNGERLGPPLFPGGPPSTLLLQTNETWSWNGTRWQRLNPATRPPPSSDHRMAADTQRGRVVLHGGSLGDECPFFGCDGENSTWEWDGTTWTQVVQGEPLTTRVRFAMAYHPGRERVVRFGGQDQPGFSISPLNELLEWDGQSWREVTPLTNNPEPRAQTLLFYDANQSALIMFGGFGFGVEFEDTWRLFTPDRPSVQLTAQLPAEVPEDAWRDLHVRAHCGGRGETGSGARLSGWQTRHPAGRFELLGTTTSTLPGDDPNDSLIEIERADAQNFVGPGNRMFFRCTPEAQSGADFAEVGLDYIEVRAAYQLP